MFNKRPSILQTIDYIIGDRIKNIPKSLAEELLSSKHHKPISASSQSFTYHAVKNQNKLVNSLKLVVPKDTGIQQSINQIFK